MNDYEAGNPSSLFFPRGPAPPTMGMRDPAQAGPSPPVGQEAPQDHEQARASAYATIAANPASEEAHAAREVLARLPKIQVGGGLGPGSVEQPDQTMMIANYMRGIR
jgi:hypothetical protein